MNSSKEFLRVTGVDFARPCSNRAKAVAKRLSRIRNRIPQLAAELRTNGERLAPSGGRNPLIGRPQLRSVVFLKNGRRRNFGRAAAAGQSLRNGDRPGRALTFFAIRHLAGVRLRRQCPTPKTNMAINSRIDPLK
jgi:hypothetical protein